MIRNIFVKIHAYLGLITSLLLSLLALSGTFLVFRNDFIKLDIGHVPKYLPANHDANLERILNVQDIGGVKSILLPNIDLPYYKLTLKNGIAYYDVNANLIEQTGVNQRFDEWIFQLHHYLLLGKEGAPFVGAIGVFCILMVVIGVYLWIRTIKMFEFRILLRSLKRRDIVTHHRNLGIVFFAPILLLAISGASMIFDDFAKSTISIFTQTKPQKSKSILVESAQIDGETVVKLVNIAQSQFYNANIRYIIFPKSTDAPLSIRMKQAGEWHPNGRTIVAMDYKNAKIADIINAEKLDITSRIYNAFYSIHSGKIGGNLYRIFIALGGIVLFVLSIFSAFSFSRSLIKRKS